MIKFPGLADYFPQLNKVEAEKIANNLHFKGDLRILKNKLANRILYSQAVAINAKDLIFDLAMIFEALKTAPGEYYNQNLKRIIIPEGILNFLPNLRQVAQVFLDAFRPQGIASILLKSQTVGVKNLGTYIRPKISGSKPLTIWIGEDKYQIQIGTISTIPVAGRKVDIKFPAGVSEVAGGDLGIVIDTRL